MYIHFGNCVNAYQQSPPPSIACYLHPDNAIVDWYQYRFKERIDPDKEVLPLHGALQGHPEAGVLWQQKINHVLLVIFKLKQCTYEQNLYIGVFRGQIIIVCRQVDDLSVACKVSIICKEFLLAIKQHVNTDYESMGVNTGTSLHQCFNGIEVEQTQDFIHLSCLNYIDQILQSHGWETPSPCEFGSKEDVPIKQDLPDKLMKLEGPIEKTKEAQALAAQKGFAY